MSLFNELQDELIEKPINTRDYYKFLKQRNNKERKTDKQIRKEKRKELLKEEFIKRYKKDYYKKKKDRYKRRYKEYQEWLENMMWEICDELRADVPDLVNRDKYYTEKYKKDDTKRAAYKFAWRSSKIRRLNWNWLPRQMSPFRISNRKGVDRCIKELLNTQWKVYEYLKPHLNEIKKCEISLHRKQQPYDYPTYTIDEPLNSLCESSDINTWRIVYVAEWMIRDKFMVTELYLWRTSFIFWDVLVTQTWNLFRIALENNLPWLTKDTVEDIHSRRMSRWKDKNDKDMPPIYIVQDAYLIKIKINERENLYYIVPT